MVVETCLDANNSYIILHLSFITISFIVLIMDFIVNDPDLINDLC